MTIEYLSFICFFGRLHLDHSSLSSFLIQMIRWIRGSSIIEFFIFLIAWGILFESWELDLQLLPSSLLLLWVKLLPLVHSSQSLLKVITSFCIHSSNEWIPWSWEAIQGGYHNFYILHFFFYRFKLFFDLRDPCKVWLHGLCWSRVPQLQNKLLV